MKLSPLSFALISLALACGPSGASSENSSGGEDDEWDDWGDEGDTATEGGSHGGAVEALGITPPEMPWADMSFEDKEYYMVGKVLPIMKEIFNEQDGARWEMSRYECATCHGENEAEVRYEMPPVSAYRVPAAGTPAYANMERIFPDIVSFMEDRVTPTMGTLLGIDDYTCQGCHPSAE